MLSDEDMNVWRSFKSGESAKAIAKRLDVGVKTVLEIVLLVESQMATSKFFEVRLDAEGCPDPIPHKPTVPTDLEQLEEWLRT